MSRGWEKLTVRQCHSVLQIEVALSVEIEALVLSLDNTCGPTSRYKDSGFVATSDVPPSMEMRVGLLPIALGEKFLDNVVRTSACPH